MVRSMKLPVYIRLTDPQPSLSSVYTHPPDRISILLYRTTSPEISSRPAYSGEMSMGPPEVLTVSDSDARRRAVVTTTYPGNPLSLRSRFAHLLFPLVLSQLESPSVSGVAVEQLLSHGP